MWKDEYSRLSKELEYLKELAKINMDLVHLSVDLENFPEAKEELRKVHELVQAVIALEKDQSEVHFSQMHMTKMEYLDQRLTDLSSMFREQELVDMLVGLMEDAFHKAVSSPQRLQVMQHFEENLPLSGDVLQSGAEFCKAAYHTSSFDCVIHPGEMAGERTGDDSDPSLKMRTVEEVKSEDSHTTEFHSAQAGPETVGSFSRMLELSFHKLLCSPHFLPLLKTNQTCGILHVGASLQKCSPGIGLPRKTEILHLGSIVPEKVHDEASTNRIVGLEDGEDDGDTGELDDNSESDLSRCKMDNADHVQISSPAPEISQPEAGQASSWKDALCLIPPRQECVLSISNTSKKNSARKKTAAAKKGFAGKRKSLPRKSLKVKGVGHPNDIIEDSMKIDASESDGAIQRSGKRDKNKVKCPICNHQYYRTSITRHIRVIHMNLKDYLCNICGRKFGFQNDLKLHMRTHAPDRKPLVCEICSKTFINYRNFTRHKRLHEGENPQSDGKNHLCSMCPKRYACPADLRVHERTHTGERPFTCAFCPKAFVSKPLLKSHTKLVHADINAPYQCPLCHRVFTKSYTMASHMLQHPEFLQGCVLCGQTFTSTSELHNHVSSIHLADKPFQCSVCGERFYSSYKLQTHKYFHKEEDPFKCCHCSKSCSSKDSLRLHKESVHGSVQHECEVCQKSFNDKGSLTRHWRIHSGEKPYECYLCGKAFSHSSVLNVHLWTHRKDKKYKCEQCDRGYNDKRALLSHVRKIHHIVTVP